MSEKTEEQWGQVIGIIPHWKMRKAREPPPPTAPFRSCDDVNSVLCVWGCPVGWSEHSKMDWGRAGGHGRGSARSRKPALGGAAVIIKSAGAEPQLGTPLDGVT